MDQGIIRFGNDEAILYLRKNHLNCSTPNNILGKMIWEWLRERGGQKIEEDKPSVWGKEGDFLGETGLPATAAQFEFDRSLMPELFNYLDLLGQG